MWTRRLRERIPIGATGYTCKCRKSLAIMRTGMPLKVARQPRKTDARYFEHRLLTSALPRARKATQYGRDRGIVFGVGGQLRNQTALFVIYD